LGSAARSGEDTEGTLVLPEDDVPPDAEELLAALPEALSAPAGFGPLCVPLLPDASGPLVGAALLSDALAPAAALPDALSVGTAPLCVPVLPGAVPAPVAAALPGCFWSWLAAGGWLPCASVSFFASSAAIALNESRAAPVIIR